MASLFKLTIENYRSFYSAQTLDFGNPMRRVNAIFGSNASGKSNTAHAISTIKNCIRNSAAANWRLPYDPFLLRVGSNAKPTRFSMSFEVDGETYDYSFSFDATHIVEETLLKKSKNTQKKRLIFERNSSGQLNKSAVKEGFGANLLKRTRPETLLITKAREDNVPYSNAVFDFIDCLLVVPGNDFPGIQQTYIDRLQKDSGLREETIALLKRCDFSIRDFRIVPVPIPEEILNTAPLDDEMKEHLRGVMGNTLRTVHAVRDDERTVNEFVEFDFGGQESLGTQKFLAVAVPIVDALRHGKIVYIDEYGAYMHAVLADSLIQVFIEQSENTEAKLIFNTHSTSVLNGLKREEVLFVEKGLSEESYISSLADRGVRKQEPFEKRYREGMYGAIPVIRG